MTDTNLPKEGDIIWNTGHEFMVTEPAVHPVTGSGGSHFSHQFTYKGVCTDHPCNDNIRNTGFNGGRYGWGINLNPVESPIHAWNTRTVKCSGCEGRGEIGGLTREGYETEMCPACKGTGIEIHS